MPEAPLFEKPRQWETDACWSLLGRQRQRGQPAGVSYICPYNTVVLLLTTWTLLQMGVDLSPRNSVDTAIAIRIDLLLDIAAGYSPEVRSSAPRAPDHAAGTKDGDDDDEACHPTRQPDDVSLTVTSPNPIQHPIQFIWRTGISFGGGRIVHGTSISAAVCVDGAEGRMPFSISYRRERVGCL